MTENSIAKQADCADALLAARRGRNWAFTLLLIVLLGQLALFFVARYSDQLIPTSVSATQPAEPKYYQLMIYAMSLCGYFALGASIVLCVILLLLTLIMVVARLIGVGKVTSAFLWSVVLFVLLFPWQAFLNNSSMTFENFKIPGVVYHWHELATNAKFQVRDLTDQHILWDRASLGWARFVGFPVLAIFILLNIHMKSSRGISQALGEEIAGAPTSDDTPKVEDKQDAQ